MSFRLPVRPVFHCSQCSYHCITTSDADRHRSYHGALTHAQPPQSRLLNCPVRGCGYVGLYAFQTKAELGAHVRKMHMTHLSDVQLQHRKPRGNSLITEHFDRTPPSDSFDKRRPVNTVPKRRGLSAQSGRRQVKFFLEGRGINAKILQREIRGYLAPNATLEPGGINVGVSLPSLETLLNAFQGNQGYNITADSIFTTVSLQTSIRIVGVC